MPHSVVDKRWLEEKLRRVLKHGDECQKMLHNSRSTRQAVGLRVWDQSTASNSEQSHRQSAKDGTRRESIEKETASRWVHRTVGRSRSERLHCEANLFLELMRQPLHLMRSVQTRSCELKPPSIDIDYIPIVSAAPAMTASYSAAAVLNLPIACVLNQCFNTVTFIIIIIIPPLVDFLSRHFA